MPSKSHREDVPVFKIPFSSDVSRTTWPEPQNQTFASSRLHLFHFFVTRRADLIAQDTHRHNRKVELDQVEQSGEKRKLTEISDFNRFVTLLI